MDFSIWAGSCVCVCSHVVIAIMENIPPPKTQRDSQFTFLLCIFYHCLHSLYILLPDHLTSLYLSHFYMQASLLLVFFFNAMLCLTCVDLCLKLVCFNLENQYDEIACLL